MTVQNLYNQYLDGKITESKFLYEVRRDINLTMISHQNSFKDTINILKSKSLISEKTHKESTGKQDVEIIAKTIDMVNPYEYSRGMNYELDILDVPAPSGDLSDDNVAKAQKKVLANLTKNPQYYFEKINGKGEVSEKWVEATKKEIDAIGKGKKSKSIMREGLGHNESSSTHQNNTTDPQSAIYEKYAQKLGKTVDEVKEMVSKRNSNIVQEDKSPLDELYSPNEKLEAKFYEDGRISLIVHRSGGRVSGQSPYLSTAAIDPQDFNYTWIKSQLSKIGLNVDNNEIDQFLVKVREKINTSNQDNLSEGEEFGNQSTEFQEIKVELHSIAKIAFDLYKSINSLGNMEKIDFPHWWQAKIILSKDYLEGAKDYLEGILPLKNVENGMEESITAKTNDSTHNADAIKQISKVPNSTSRAELTKAFNSGKTIDI